MSKTWVVIDDEGLYPYRTETRGEARARHAEEFDIPFYESLEWSVRRCPALDDLPLTIYYAMVTRVINHAEMGCICGESIYADVDDDGKLMIYTLKDNRGVSVVKPDWDDECYCSWTCAMRAHGDDERIR